MFNKYFLTLLFLVIAFGISWGQVPHLTQEDKISSFKTHLLFESDSIQNFIVYRGFVVNYNFQFKIPNFTYHKLTYEQILESGSKAKRRSSFFVDDINLKNMSSLNLDYKGSGYDRGHMVPAGDFYSDKILKDETFVLSNVCPQHPGLNRGIWAGMENLIRQKIISLNADAYIVTGTILPDDSVYIIGNNVGIPRYFYKLIYIPQASEMYAFMFDNTLQYYYGSVQDYQVSVNDIEAIIQGDFFELLDDDVEEILETEIIPLLK